MNKYTSSIILFLFFSTQIILSQNSVSYSPSATTISANSGVEVLVPITVTCSGNWTTTSIGVQPANTCSNMDGYTGIDYTNNITHLTPGHSTVIKFKFKKTVSTNTSITYSFTNNGSCASPQIKITVNYVSSPTSTQSCTLSPPQNLSISNVTTNSVNLNWNNTQGALYYKIYYKKSSSTAFPSVVDSGCCSATISSLEPYTKYDFSVYPMCSNGSGYASSLSATTLCLPKAPATNLNALLWGGAWTISFTPAQNENSYTMEYVDLINNNGGVTQITYSNTPNYYSNFFYNVPTNHNFKFRLLQGCGGDSEWKNIDVSSCSIILPTGLFIYNIGSSLTFNWTTITNSQNYQGEYVIFNLAGQQVSGSFTSLSNVYSTTINTNTVSGNKFVKFRIKSQCLNGNWSDFSPYSNITAWNQ